MGDFSVFGKLLVFMGLGLTALGLLLWGASRLLPIGRLPGDILFQREGVTVYFPIVTCILLSILLTLVLNLLRR